MKKERFLKYLILICSMVVSFFIFASHGVSALEEYSVNDGKIILELEQVNEHDVTEGYVISGARVGEGVTSVTDFVVPDEYTDGNPIVGIKDSDNSLVGVLSNISSVIEGSVTLGQNIEYLGRCSFCNFTKVTQYELNENLDAIGEYAFSNNPALLNVVVKAYNDGLTALADSNVFNSTANVRRLVFKNAVIVSAYKESDVWNTLSITFTYKINYRFYSEDRQTLITSRDYYHGEAIGEVPAGIEKTGLKFGWVSESNNREISSTSVAIDVNHVDGVTLNPVHDVYPSWKLKEASELFLKTIENGNEIDHKAASNSIEVIYSGKNNKLNIKTIIKHELIDETTGDKAEGFTVSYSWVKVDSYGMPTDIIGNDSIFIFRTGESGTYKCTVTLGYIGYESVVKVVAINVKINPKPITINVDNQEYEYGTHVVGYEDKTGELFAVDTNTSLANGEMIKSFYFSGYCKEDNGGCEQSTVGVKSGVLSGVVTDVGYEGDSENYSSEYVFTYVEGDLVVVPKVINHTMSENIVVTYGEQVDLIQNKSVEVYGTIISISIRYVREDESNENVGEYDVLSAVVVNGGAVDNNYDIKLASQNAGKVIIQAKPVEVNWVLNGEEVYTGEEKPITATYRDINNQVKELSVDVKKNGVNSVIKNAGTYNLTATMIENDDNYSLVNSEYNLFIDKAESILKGNQTQSVTYNGREQTVNVTLNHGGLIRKTPANGGICKDAGESASSFCTIYVTVDETENYKATSGTYYLRILRARKEVTPKVFEHTYGTVISNLNLCDVYPGVGDEVLSICFNLKNTGILNSVLPVGYYDIQSAYTNDSMNYEVRLADGAGENKIKINPAPVEIKFFYYEGLVYDGQVKDIRVKYLGTTEDVGLSLDYGDKEIIRDAGSYRIDASISNPNYYIQGDSYIEFDIAKAKYDVSKLKLNDSKVKFNFKNHFIILEGELPSGLKAVYTIDGVKGNGTGLPFKHTVKVSFEGDYDNYEYVEPLVATLYIDMSWLWVTLGLTLFFGICIPLAIYFLIKYKIIKVQPLIRRGRIRRLIRKNRELDKLNQMFREKQANWLASQNAEENIEIVEEPIKFVKKSVGKMHEGIIEMSFVDELFKSEYGTKQFYSEVKNELLSYEGVVSKIKRDYETFYLNNMPIAKLDVVKGQLYAYFALDPSQYKKEDYKHEDVSKQKDFASVPLKLKVHSIESLRHAKMFVRIIRKKEGIKAVSNFIRTDYVSVYTAKESSLSRFKKAFVKKGTKEYFED